MDEMVLQAMVKWPNVPACRGWLGLSARGDWCMRDAAAQASGPFAGTESNAKSKGSPLRHEALIAFIGRNYAVDAHGCWYFQNGPQRVFVELEATPWIMRVLHTESGWEVRTHTGKQVQPTQALCDEEGRVYLAGDWGVGLVHTADTVVVAEALEQGVWPLAEVQAQDLPARFGFVLSPERQA